MHGLPVAKDGGNIARMFYLLTRFITIFPCI
jgi:hypothetical protein